MNKPQDPEAAETVQTESIEAVASAAICPQCADHGKFYLIWCNIDNIMNVMRPRYVGDASMNGRYPCWVVWLPKEGKTERKTLKDALIAFVDQSSEIHSENTEGLASTAYKP
jgi:hypothetical protein